MKRARLLVAHHAAVKIEIAPATTKETALRAFPATRGECEDGERPCPHVRCRYHLEHATETCALDVADEGPKTFAAIGELMGLTRVRVFQIATAAIAKGRLTRG